MHYYKRNYIPSSIIPTHDYFYHQENGSKALALRATLRAVGLDNHFFDDFFYPMGRKPLLHAHKKTPLNKQGLNEIELCYLQLVISHLEQLTLRLSFSLSSQLLRLVVNPSLIVFDVYGCRWQAVNAARPHTHQTQLATI